MKVPQMERNEAAGIKLGKSHPSISEVVERVGFGTAQLKATVFGGGIWLAAGVQLLLINAVTGAVSAEWSLLPWQRSFLVSVVFMGMTLGNAVSGPLGDSFGRRLPVLLCYAGIFVFSCASACATSMSTLGFFRISLGFWIGVGQPAYSTLSTEITPAFWRIPMTGVAQILFALGEAYSAMLLLHDGSPMSSLDWRRLLVYGLVPVLMLAVPAYFLLHESPAYLALRGDHQGARRSLEGLAADNGERSASLDYQPPAAVAQGSTKDLVARQFGIVFGRHMLVSTMTMVFTCFVLNILFYGCLYAFPLIVGEAGMGASPAVALLQGALWEIPGFTLGVMCGLWLPRKPCMLLYLVLIAAALMAFATGATAGEGSWYAYHLMHGGYAGIKMVVCIGFVVVYQYACEIYPAAARTTGTAMCIAGGRIGAMLAPFTFEMAKAWTGTFATFFHIGVGLAAVNAVLIVFLPSVDIEDLETLTA